MGAEETNRKEILTRIAADLFAKSKGGEELSARISRLRAVIVKVIESEDTLFGKFRGLVESFREIIPEEKQRYSAAIKALSTTSKVSQQDIVKAITDQLEEIKILEKVLFSAPVGWRDELTVMQARSKELKDEIVKQRENLTRLESEEQEIANGLATRDKEVELVSKAVEGLFTDITAEINAINKKVAEATAISAAPAPIPPKAPAKTDVPVQQKAVVEQKNEILEPSRPPHTDSQKACPMCGGRMDYYSSEKKWMCFSCAFEELKEEKASGEKTDNEQKSESLEPSASLDAQYQKKCPMCGGRMDYYSNDKKWMCFSCAFEESTGGEGKDKSEEKHEQVSALKPASDPSPSLAIPDETLFPTEYRGSKKEGSQYINTPSVKKKTCPVCRKKMQWYEMENTWRCPFCDYERKI